MWWLAAATEPHLPYLNITQHFSITTWAVAYLCLGERDSIPLLVEKEKAAMHRHSAYKGVPKSGRVPKPVHWGHRNRKNVFPSLKQGSEAPHPEHAPLG